MMRLILLILLFPIFSYSQYNLNIDSTTYANWNWLDTCKADTVFFTKGDYRGLGSFQFDRSATKKWLVLMHNDVDTLKKYRNPALFPDSSYDVICHNAQIDFANRLTIQGFSFRPLTGTLDTNMNEIVGGSIVAQGCNYLNIKNCYVTNHISALEGYNCSNTILYKNIMRKGATTSDAPGINFQSSDNFGSVVGDSSSHDIFIVYNEVSDFGDEIASNYRTDTTATTGTRRTYNLNIVGNDFFKSSIRIVGDTVMYGENILDVKVPAYPWARNTVAYNTFRNARSFVPGSGSGGNGTAVNIDKRSRHWDVYGNLITNATIAALVDLGVASTPGSSWEDGLEGTQDSVYDIHFTENIIHNVKLNAVSDTMSVGLRYNTQNQDRMKIQSNLFIDCQFPISIRLGSTDINVVKNNYAYPNNFACNVINNITFDCAYLDIVRPYQRFSITRPIITKGVVKENTVLINPISNPLWVNLNTLKNETTYYY